MCRFGQQSFREGHRLPSETPETLPASARCGPRFLILRRGLDEKRGRGPGQDRMGNVSCLGTAQFTQPQSLPLQTRAPPDLVAGFLLELVGRTLPGGGGRQTALSLDSDRRLSVIRQRGSRWTGRTVSSTKRTALDMLVLNGYRRSALLL